MNLKPSLKQKEVQITERESDRHRGEVFGFLLLFFINIPEVGVDGLKLSGEGRITHTHSENQQDWAWETKHTQTI